MKSTFETFAPVFPGFYNTVFEYDQEQDDIDYYNEENGTNLSYEDFNWEYGGYMERVSRLFVDRLESELRQFIDIRIEFQSIYSPKEYNFKNDSINIKVELDLDILLKLIAGKYYTESEKYIKDTYTSHSGFVSFHSNKIEDWLNKEYILENPEHRIGALLECICFSEIDTDNIYYWCDSGYYMEFEPTNC